MFKLKKTIFKILFLIVLFFTYSCDIVDAITDIFNGDDDDITNTANPGYNLIGTQVIGSSGGEINLDSIIVNVPSGAFDENTELSIYVREENDGFGEYGITALYQLQGLPAMINKPVRLSIKYHGTLEGDTLIAIGEMQYATSLDSSLYSYETDNASDSSEYLVYNIPSYSNLGKLQQIENTTLTDFINFIGLGGYKQSKSSNGNFTLSYPIVHEANAIKMGEHFETAYNKCINLGFSLSGREWQTNPAHVLTMPLRQGLGGYYSNWGANNMTDDILKSLIYKGDFTINLGILSDDLELRTVCGHEFLHLVQNLYEFSSPWIEPEQNWMKEATSTWIMEKFANIPNYVPSVHNGRELYPLIGWQYSNLPKIKHAEIGYGLSVIFKDIADRYGISEIVKIFDKIKEGTLPNNVVDPVEAVKSIVEWWEPLENFWHGVLSSYVLGDYYNSQVNFKVLNMTSDYHKSGTIDVQNSKLIFNESYQDLSGMLFKVTPGDFSTISTVPLSFSVDDPANCGLLVCKYKQGTEITSLGEVYPGGSGQVIISNAKPLFDAGYELMVLVSNGSHDKNNNYEGINNVILTIDLVTPEVLNGSVRFKLDDVVTDRSSSRAIEEVLHFNGLNGNFSNNNYNGSYNYESLGRTYSGTVDIAFIENPESINFHLNGQYTYESLFGFGTVTFCYSVGYNGIPYTGLEGAYHVYSVIGRAVQNGYFSWSETNSQWIEKLISWDCGDGAYITVQVDRRE